MAYNKNQKLERLQKKVSKITEIDNSFSGWRTLLFIFAFVLWCFVGIDMFPKIFLPVASAVSLAFIVTISFHRKVRKNLYLFKSRLNVEERQKAITDLDWEKIPYTDFRSINLNIPYLTDLNIIGEFSIVKLLNRTTSISGFKRLIELFLSNDVINAEIKRRKDLVNELKSLKIFRYAFLSHMGVNPKPIDAQKISTLLKESLSSVQSFAYFIPMLFIQIAFLTSFVMAMIGRGNKTLLIATFILVVIENTRLRKKVKTGEAYGWSVSASHYLDSFRLAVQILEKFNGIKKPELSKILAVFAPENSVSSRIKKLEQVSGALGVRQNFIVHGIVHLFTPWDILWTYRLDKIRQQIKNDLPIWEKALSEIEAFLSLAMYAEANLDFCDAHVTTGSILIDAKNLRHPLIPKDRAVGNPIVINDTEKCILITGSNMSGKSTFMRSIGVNYLLAKVGAPVAAESFNFDNEPLYTSLSGGDSLQEGLSSFYAEVKRLKDILEATKSKKSVLFLIDEIFRGTNNRERLTGSQAYIKEIVSIGGKGVVTSHDLELAQLEQLNIGIANYHFRETIKDSEMSFSYEKQKGPCPTTNALQVMKLNGLPVSL
ncbi:MAG: hypothetical protein V4596_14430 [Bdellovibrionota bacterium]